jgi:peptide/nickel transport system ATP-binding protein
MSEVPLLQLEHLHIVKTSAKGQDYLVHDLSLCLDQGQSLGLVGESGSGKSLTAWALLQLLPSPQLRIQSGRILFRGQDLCACDEKQRNQLRGSRIAMIVQDALAALNPVRRIKAQLAELFQFHTSALSASAKQARILQCLHEVGLPDGERILRAFPHELSGGMRQRVLLAMALLLEPELLIADEPTTALDVTLQAKFVAELRRLRAEKTMALLFISHDFALVLELCERVLVLYRGHMMETGPTEALLEDPWHPYTQAMIAALPRQGQMSIGAQEPALSMQKGAGSCPYASQCPKVHARCLQQQPKVHSRGNRQLACHLFEL